MSTHVFAKADSVEFLDLCAPEFHETRNTTLIYALDLSVAPERYDYQSEWFDETMDEDYPPYPRLVIKPLYSSRKLIEVARSNDRARYSSLSFYFSEDNSPLSFLFSDFIINGFESFPRNWESERIRLYLKYVEEYCHYIAESIIVAHPDPETIILTFEGPPIALDTDANSSFIRQIKNRMARKLILTLSATNSDDSSLVAEIFQKMCIGEQRINLLFVHEAKVTEYLLHHLKKERYDFGHMFETLQESPWKSSLLRCNPEHLVVLLNYGLKIKSQLEIWDIKFFQFYPSCQEKMYWGTPAILKRGRSVLNTREEAILDIFSHFLTFSVPHFTIYLKSLRYIWRSIPDAFITYEEMRTLLLRKSEIRDVQNTCRILQKWNFECFDTILQPRRLKHYSRCVIRDSLQRNSQLPEGLQLLGLPNEFKSYLRLEF